MRTDIKTGYKKDTGGILPRYLEAKEKGLYIKITNSDKDYDY